MAFEPPARLDYLITDVRGLPFRHEGGSIRLEPDGTGTHAVWTSSFEIPIPLLGRPLDRIFSTQLERGFSSDARAERRALSAARVRQRLRSRHRPEGLSGVAAPLLARPLTYQVPLWQPPPSVPEPAVQLWVVSPFAPLVIVKVLLTPFVTAFETAVML